jgi:hypothetical protein
MELPLQLKVDPKSKPLKTRLSKLEAYDFADITADVQRYYGWSAKKAADIEVRAKQFLCLAFLDPGHYHIPEQDIDDYWHRMILHSKWYEKFCNSIFKTFYHHTPEPDPIKLNQANRDRTKAVAEYWFGTPFTSMVRTCTQCKGPITPVDLRPALEMMPRIQIRKARAASSMRE